MSKWHLLIVFALVWSGLSLSAQAQSWDVELEAPAVSTGDTVDFPADDLDWGGALTLVMQVKDLGSETDAPGIALNFESGYRWVLGHGPASSDGTVANPTGADGLVDGQAGWIFDLENTTNGGAVKTYGLGDDAIIRVIIVRTNVETDAGSQQALRLIGWQDGNKVFDDVAIEDTFGDFLNAEVLADPFEESLELDWVVMSFFEAWQPLEGPATFNLTAAGEPTSSDSPGWDFSYNGELLPETLVDMGNPNWAPREGETTGQPEYESIVPSVEAQTGSIWSRIDDNSEGSGSEPWANGYLFGNDHYENWNGRLTLAMRIRDLGTDSQKSVLDITNSVDGTEDNYWTLGHVAASGDGPAGWEFGQTDDGRNGNGTNNDTRVGGFGQFVEIRIVIEDDDPTDGASQVWGFLDGELVYTSTRTDDIGPGQLGQIAFRRTSGGSMQKMEIDWIVAKFGETWLPGEGAATPADLSEKSLDLIANDGETPSPERVQQYLDGELDTLESRLIEGAIGMDNFGLVKTVRDSAMIAGLNEIFETDRNGMPANLNIFYLGFDAMRDVETVGNPQGDLTGLIFLDRFGGLHNFAVQGPGEVSTGPGLAITQPTTSTQGPGLAVSAPVNGPRFDYISSVVDFNEAHDEDVGLPYFDYRDAEGNSIFAGIQDGAGDPAIARDIEVAVDWRTATHAFRGYYMLDVFGGVHFVGEAELMNLVQNLQTPTDPGTDQFGQDTFFSSEGVDLFHDLLGFKPVYQEDYNGEDSDVKKRAPYFSGASVMRDMEVYADFVEMTPELVGESVANSAIAELNGVDTDSLFHPIEIPVERLDRSSPMFTPRVLITQGYVMMDGFGGIHSLIEDDNGEPVPAPWESEETGLVDPSVNAPYFFDLDLAVDFELYPNGGGFAVLTRTGELFTVNAVGTTREDHFIDPDFDDELPVFGFDAARDLQLISNELGQIVGFYILDRFGNIYNIGDVPEIPQESLFLPTGDFSTWQAERIEFAPYQSVRGDVVTSPE